jgi:hypothetical protein
MKWPPPVSRHDERVRRLTQEVTVPEQSAEGSTTETADSLESTEPTEAADAPVDQKAVFAAALAKKKAAGQARSAHLDGHGGVGGATASHKATRTFRRKSG